MRQKIDMEDRCDKHKKTCNALKIATVTAWASLVHKPRPHANHRTYRGDHESNKGRVVPSSNAVIDPLAMMVTTIDAIIALFWKAISPKPKGTRSVLRTILQ